MLSPKLITIVVIYYFCFNLIRLIEYFFFFDNDNVCAYIQLFKTTKIGIPSALF